LKEGRNEGRLIRERKKMQREVKDVKEENQTKEGKKERRKMKQKKIRHMLSSC
jgi:hypothetical protein